MAVLSLSLSLSLFLSPDPLSAMQPAATQPAVFLCGCKVSFLQLIQTSSSALLLFSQNPTPPFVVILTSFEVKPEVKRLLQYPLYRASTKILHGSALVEDDLRRAGVDTARAVFLLSERCVFRERESESSG